MSPRDDFTSTVEGAAAFEKARAEREDDFDEPYVPDPSEYADLVAEVYGWRRAR